MKLSERLLELWGIPYKIDNVMYKEILEKKLARIPLDFQDTRNVYNMAMLTLKAIADDDKLHAYIFGSVGTGKTYISFEILKIIWRMQLPGRFVLFQKDIHQLTNKEDLSAYTEMISSYKGLLIIDEMFYDDASYGKIGAYIYDMLNNRFIDHYPTIITTNHSPDDVENLIPDPRITRRIHDYCYITEKTTKYGWAKCQNDSEG